MIALVTGASSGIGQAMLPLFGADRHDLILVARRAELLAQQKADLERRHGVRVWSISLDLAAPGAPAELFRRTRDLGLDVDVLVNNAGFGMYGLFHEQSRTRQREMIDLNIGALTELTHLYLEPMRLRGRGKILHTSSTAAFQPGPRLAVYYATKAYVLSFSEALSCELAGSGVTVTALCPGPTRSEFNDVASYQMPLVLASSMMTSDAVARVGYRALMKGKRLAVAGVTNRLAAITSQLAPRGLILAVADRLTRARA
jgi:short-subunit dehydrogenase